MANIVQNDLGIGEIEYVEFLMASSISGEDWNKNADKIKKMYGGNYPSFWYEKVILSGIYSYASKNWDALK